MVVVRGHKFCLFELRNCCGMCKWSFSNDGKVVHIRLAMVKLYWIAFVRPRKSYRIGILFTHTHAISTTERNCVSRSLKWRVIWHRCSYSLLTWHQVILFIYLFIYFFIFFFLLLYFFSSRAKKITPSSRGRHKGIIGRGHEFRLTRYRTTFRVGLFLAAFVCHNLMYYLAVLLRWNRIVQGRFWICLNHLQRVF